MVEYASKKFNATERRYSTTERECYALVWALRHFRNIIAYDEIIIFTDHSALTAFANAKKETEAKPITGVRFPRWMHEVDSYRVTITYRPGKQMQHADALSRPPFIHAVRGTSDSSRTDSEYSDGESYTGSEYSSNVVPQFLFRGDTSGDEIDLELARAGGIVVSKISQENIIAAQRKERFSKTMIKYFLNRKARLERRVIRKLPMDEMAMLPRDLGQWAILDRENGATMPILVHTNQKENIFLEDKLKVERPDDQGGG